VPPNKSQTSEETGEQMPEYSQKTAPDGKLELLLNSSSPEEEDGSPASTLDDEPSAEDFSM